MRSALMIVFAGPAGLRASYFDSEGHVIQYAIAMPGAPDFQHYTGGAVHRVHPSQAAP